MRRTRLEGEGSRVASGGRRAGERVGGRNRRIAIVGDSAAVAVRCRIFLEMAQTLEGPRHRAENNLDYELTLERVGDAWLVSGEWHRFAPGGGP